jgi:hypothetical protein
LNEKQEVYSRKIVPTLSAKLAPQFGSGFSARNLSKMIHFAEAFNDMEIVAAGKSSEQIELLQLDKSGIKVAEYLTQLPDRELLKQKLHKAVIMAREQMRKKMRSDRAEYGNQIVQSLIAQLQRNSNGQGQGEK